MVPPLNEEKEWDKRNKALSLSSSQKTLRRCLSWAAPLRGLSRFWHKADDLDDFPRALLLT